MLRFEQKMGKSLNSFVWSVSFRYFELREVLNLGPPPFSLNLTAQQKTMGWVNEALEQLSAGQQAQIRPQGGSMRGRIES